MTSPVNIIELCSQDLAEKVNQIDGLQDRAFLISSEAEMDAKTKGIGSNYVGIMWDGARSVPGAGGRQAPHHSSLGGGPISAEASFTLILTLRLQPIALEDPKFSAAGLLFGVRNIIARSRSPSGHWWKWGLEVSLPTSGTKSITYVQRWSTAVQL